LSVPEKPRLRSRLLSCPNQFRVGDVQAATLSCEPKEGRQSYVTPSFDGSGSEERGPTKLRHPGGVSEVFTPYSRPLHALPSRG